MYIESKGSMLHAILFAHRLTGWQEELISDPETIFLPLQMFICAFFLSFSPPYLAQYSYTHTPSVCSPVLFPCICGTQTPVPKKANFRLIGEVSQARTTAWQHWWPDQVGKEIRTKSVCGYGGLMFSEPSCAYLFPTTIHPLIPGLYFLSLLVLVSCSRPQHWGGYNSDSFSSCHMVMMFYNSILCGYEVTCLFCSSLDPML